MLLDMRQLQRLLSALHQMFTGVDSCTIELLTTATHQRSNRLLPIVRILVL